MNLKDISTSVPKKDHKGKVSGQLPYISDVKVENMVYGVLYRSPIAYGKIISIQLPNLPEGYEAVGAEHIPGPNYVKIIKEDQPILPMSGSIILVSQFSCSRAKTWISCTVC
ncbi:hypothetical protein KEH51_12460 [[Brevibacterium] frigoritolerans]|uniref:Aldehyde oxidase/xanthine dehydrogenase a/b hammerhead domain-containing protein n=1 Tax=Peribacillus frigoritolerans TaxID=450367 RepID=A0A941FQW5_9BACI|nr:hypothetical protein [Peribacillus frigoritolerans]